MAYGQVSADVIQSSVSGVSLGAGNSSIMKNRIINGAMVIDQRNAGASISTSSGIFTYTVDRWRTVYSQTGKFTLQQNQGSVTPPVGFVNYLGATSSSAYSVGSSELFVIQQLIEGYNVADLGWGTASAKPVTLSFQVYSSLTGTFGGSLQNNAANRSYPFSYSVPVANTWTTVSVTIAGDTSGTWLTTNGVGIQVWFGLGVGSTSSGTAGSWAGAAYLSATGATSVVGTNGATFYITGVQLEVGSSATGFEYVNYQTSLANCERYYQVIAEITCNGSAALSGTTFSSTLRTYPRATPTVTATINTGTALSIYPKANSVSFTATSSAGNAVTINNVLVTAEL